MKSAHQHGYRHGRCKSFSGDVSQDDEGIRLPIRVAAGQGKNLVEVTTDLLRGMIRGADFQVGNGRKRFGDEDMLQRAGGLHIRAEAFLFGARSREAADEEGEQGYHENEFDQYLKRDRERSFDHIPLIDGSQSPRLPVKLEEQEKGSAENAGAIQQNRGNEKQASVPIAGDGAAAEQHNNVNLEGQTQKDPQAGGGCWRRNPEHVKTDSQRVEKRQDQYGAPDERSFCFQNTREKEEGSGEPHGTKCFRKDIAKPER